MKIELVRLHPRAVLPEYATAGAAALDLAALSAEGALFGDSDWVVEAGQTRLFSTGIAVHIADPGVALLLVPRSGLGARQELVLGNGTGLIDSDYQGEIKVALWNRGRFPRMVVRGDRIAQGFFVPVLRPQLVEVDGFSVASARGAGGFGSTGV